MRIRIGQKCRISIDLSVINQHSARLQRPCYSLGSKSFFATVSLCAPKYRSYRNLFSRPSLYSEFNFFIVHFCIFVARRCYFQLSTLVRSYASLYSSILGMVHSLLQSFNRRFVHSFNHSFNHLFSDKVIQSLIRSFIHSFS